MTESDNDEGRATEEDPLPVRCDDQSHLEGDYESQSAAAAQTSARNGLAVCVEPTALVSARG